MKKQTREELKSELKDRIQTIFKEEMDFLGYPAAKREEAATQIVDAAEKSAKGPSNRALMIAFNKQVKLEKQEVQQVAEMLMARAFSRASRHPCPCPQTTPQPKSFSLPSGPARYTY